MCHFFLPTCFVHRHTPTASHLFSYLSHCLSRSFSMSLSLLAENLCFWQACEEVRHGESSRIVEKVEEIYKWEFEQISMQKYTFVPTLRITQFFCAFCSEISWRLERLAGSTSTARQWIKLWTGSGAHIVLSWMMHKCTFTFWWRRSDIGLHCNFVFDTNL